MIKVNKNSDNYEEDLIFRLIGSKNKNLAEKFIESDENYFENLIENQRCDECLMENAEDDKFKGKKIGVYVKTNLEGYITDINSDIFIKNFDGWVKLDEGYGDRYAHAQNKYFGRSLINENGNYRYKI